jgi:cystathionine gamma-synthase
MFPAETLAGMEAKAYWQHTGEIVSSRRAKCALRELGIELDKVCVTLTDSQHHCSMVHHAASESCSSVYAEIQAHISKLTNVPPQNVHLVASGMASIAKALCIAQQLALQQKQHGGTSIVFGFPYLDTLKLCSRSEFCPGGVEFFGRADANDLKKLETLLASGTKQVSVLFTEIPSNPLLQTPDFRRLRELANEYDFCLVVDDTIGNFCNVNLLEDAGGADVVCTSLTKLFSGCGDAMAGSLVVNPHSDMGRRIQTTLLEEDEEMTLFVANAWAIHVNLQDFV